MVRIVNTNDKVEFTYAYLQILAINNARMETDTKIWIWIDSAAAASRVFLVGLQEEEGKKECF